MNEKQSGSRSDDCGGLRDVALDYISEDMNTPLLPTILKKSPKCGIRGFHHPVLAWLLCPIVLLHQLDTDPEHGRFAFSLDTLTICIFYRLLTRLQDGSEPVTAEDFPAFLYEDPTQFDSCDIKRGLCRGYFLLRVHFSNLTRGFFPLILIIMCRSGFTFSKARLPLHSMHLPAAPASIRDSRASTDSNM